MASVTITMIYCVHEASGTDLSVIQSIADLPGKIVPDGYGFSSLLDKIRTLPGVIAAIDVARADPDDLYVTTTTEAGIHNSIWPGHGETRDMAAGQSASPMVTINFYNNLNISLWDEDFSGDDLLGSVTVFESERGQGEMAKLARSRVEGSVYYVFYRVD